MSRCTPELSKLAFAAQRFVKRRSKLHRLKSLRRKLVLARGRRRALRSSAGPAKGQPRKPQGECSAGAAKRKEAPAVGPDQPRQSALPEKKRKAEPSPTDGGGPERAPKTAAAAQALREQLSVRIEDDPCGDCPAPVSTFEELSALPGFVLSNLRSNGMTRPMPIQAQALPLVLAGRDVIGLAQTGSGKTLAFLLPVPVRIPAQRAVQHEGVPAPSVLILAPTRELAVQISDEAEKVLASQEAGGIRTACVYGGGDKWKQQRRLQWGVDVVAATPGRLLDFVQSKALSLERVSYFVLDEADRMLDLGFQDDVNELARLMRKDRQVLFFSATWNADVQKLAQGLCRSGSKPVRISYGQGGGDATEQDARHQAREGIVQQVVVVDEDGGDREAQWERQDKKKRAFLEKHLREVLEASPEHKVLVFVSMKQFADEVSAQLQKAGFSADAMHGGRSQEYRLWVLDQFRRGDLRLLVCTDVLGRGIDIPSVSHVVIYEMGEIQDYIHRIGRTARGRHGKGHALVFFEYWEGAPNGAAELIDVLAASKQTVPADLRRIADEVVSGKRKVRKGG
eukprot:CAMPEP_0171209804 /NCGR_PEP_ID=MMETSP0790-20130122/28781_1 /TAXON_ID=2925 /ORGANISM="Alexandrium catenella, Strain OF101" /LENGTH=566 /DNA_ID=CAMNT_0011675419 /DNA_START=1 /DNA_END=1697 /DNA_ORIENTATION=+